MSINYLLLKNILIRNANALSGALIAGFPAVTAWLGFIHALERKVRKKGFRPSGLITPVLSVTTAIYNCMPNPAE